MSEDFTIQRAIPNDSYEVAVMVGELLAEIMEAIGERVFNFDLAETASRLRDFLDLESILSLSFAAGVETRQGL